MTATPKTAAPATTGTPLSPSQQADCRFLLSECELFDRFDDEQLATLASHMKARSLPSNDTFLHQGDRCQSFMLLKEGNIRRDYVDAATGKTHQVEFAIRAKSINTMRVLSGDPLHNSVTCVTPINEKCQLYETDRTQLLALLQRRPDMAISMAAALSEQVRYASKKYRTPMLEQEQQLLNVPAVILAAGIESYYRSALNAQINRILTGVTSAPLFPNMHIQVPVHVRTLVPQHAHSSSGPYFVHSRL